MSARTHSHLEPPPDLSEWAASGSRHAAAGLTSKQLHQLKQAGLRQKKLLRAGKVASVNATCTTIFAAIALIGGVFNTLSLVMGLALAGVAWNEFRGRKLLRKMDLIAPRVLGWNQLAFMGLLIGYSAWNIYLGLTGPSAYAAQIAAHPQIDSMFGLRRLEKLMTVSIYGSLIVATILVQGGCAWYYFSRKKHLLAYVSDTAPWVMDIQRANNGA